MKIIYPIIFKFGDILIETINEHSKDKYLALSKNVIGSNEVVWANDNDKTIDNLFYTTNIYKQTAQEVPDFIAYLFDSWLKEKTKIFAEEKITNQDVVFLIDLRGIDRDQQIYHLSILLNRILSKEPNGSLKAILILERNPVKGDILFKHLFALENVGKVIHVDKTHDILTDATLPTDNQDEIQINRIYPDSVSSETLQGKLIRKVGHFKPDSETEICSRHFYDARYCDIDVRKLTLEFIISKPFNVSEFEYIFYISRVSPWLRESMSALSGDIEADLKNKFTSFKGAFNYEKIDDQIIANYKGGHILLVADFMNTAKSIKKAISDVGSKLVALKKDKLHLLSILNNTLQKDYKDNVRAFNIGATPYEVPFMAGVEVKEDAKKDCELCKLNIVHSDLFEDTYLKLRSFDFWDIGDENGYDFEKYKPDYAGRERLYVPTFVNWLNENAPYLTYKFQKFIEKEKINSQLNLVIIHPDETKGKEGEGRKLEETASGRFAHKLKEILKSTIIGVPRNVIDDVINGKLKKDEIVNMDAEWKNAIKNIPPSNTDVIILDEFYKGGKTFETIREIIQWLGNDAKGFFTIADFNPSKAKEYRETHEKFEFYNLYEFNNRLIS